MDKKAEDFITCAITAYEHGKTAKEIEDECSRHKEPEHSDKNSNQPIIQRSK